MVRTIARPAAAIALAIALVSLVLLALGASPAGVFAALVEGAFGNWYACTDTLVKATPLVFAGLAVSVAFSGGLWNIGADGQLTAGAIAAGAVGPRLNGMPHLLAIAIVLGAGAAGGALWGAIAGWLRARRDVNEVISTIMLNFIAVQTLSWTVHGPLMEASGAYPASVPIADSAKLAFYFIPSRLNSGMLLAIALAIACYLMLSRTTAGFELRAMGHNRRAAAFFGIPIAALTVRTMTLCGALAGIGGAVQIAAITHRLYEKFSPGWGYEAIAVALVARLNPLGVIVAALLFGALDNGSQAMQRAQGVSPVLVQVIQGMVILILLTLDTPLFNELRGRLQNNAVASPVEGERRDA
ncbi:MAG TPA: ABC transporter permease [Candidatus Binataceae bacterium]|nr:ABC transporter permease [Candidatus Binataceae bacterium]